MNSAPTAPAAPRSISFNVSQLALILFNIVAQLSEPGRENAPLFLPAQPVLLQKTFEFSWSPGVAPLRDKLPRKSRTR